MGQLCAKNGIILGPIPKISQKTFFLKNRLLNWVQTGTGW
jgi:hypothetical protein